MAEARQRTRPQRGDRSSATGATSVSSNTRNRRRSLRRSSTGSTGSSNHGSETPKTGRKRLDRRATRSFDEAETSKSNTLESHSELNLSQIQTSKFNNGAESVYGISSALTDPLRPSFDLDNPRNKRKTKHKNEDEKSPGDSISLSSELANLTEEQKAWAGIERVLNNDNESIATREVLSEEVINAMSGSFYSLGSTSFLQSGSRLPPSMPISERTRDDEENGDISCRYRSKLASMLSRQQPTSTLEDDLPTLMNSSFSSLKTDLTDLRSICTGLTRNNILTENEIQQGALHGFLEQITTVLEQEGNADGSASPSADFGGNPQIFDVFSWSKNKKNSSAGDDSKSDIDAIREEGSSSSNDEILRQQLAAHIRNSLSHPGEDDNKSLRSIDKLNPAQASILQWLLSASDGERKLTPEDEMNASMPSLATYKEDLTLGEDVHSKWNSYGDLKYKAEADSAVEHAEDQGDDGDEVADASCSRGTYDEEDKRGIQPNHTRTDALHSEHNEEGGRKANHLVTSDGPSRVLGVLKESRTTTVPMLPGNCDQPTAREKSRDKLDSGARRRSFGEGEGDTLENVDDDTIEKTPTSAKSRRASTSGKKNSKSRSRSSTHRDSSRSKSTSKSKPERPERPERAERSRRPSARSSCEKPQKHPELHRTRSAKSQPTEKQDKRPNWTQQLSWKKSSREQPTREGSWKGAFQKKSKKKQQRDTEQQPSPDSFDDFFKSERADDGRADEGSPTQQAASTEGGSGRLKKIIQGSPSGRLARFSPRKTSPRKQRYKDKSPFTSLKIGVSSLPFFGRKNAQNVAADAGRREANFYPDSACEDDDDFGGLLSPS